MKRLTSFTIAAVICTILSACDAGLRGNGSSEYSYGGFSFFDSDDDWDNSTYFDSDDDNSSSSSGSSSSHHRGHSSRASDSGTRSRARRR